MSLLEKTKYLLKQNRILPSKSKGQNFLISEEVLENIITSADLKEGENILEIGPGIGTLTEALLEKKVNLKVIELDKELIKVLDPLSKINQFEIISSDILRANLEETLSLDFLKSYKIISNLPYNITSRFLRIILEHQYPPQEMVLMLQKEVAERIVNKDGKWSKLSVMCNFYSQPEYLFTVPKNSFLPEPKVESAVIKFVIRPTGEFIQQADEKKFWQLVKIGFSSKRRTLINNLSIGLKEDKRTLRDKLEKLGLNENIRAEKLSIENWAHLVKSNII
jgi:16S rRNA (adenine1518-N6/adenine1519-N6)-dimethyltransferase